MSAIPSYPGPLFILFCWGGDCLSSAHGVLTPQLDTGSLAVLCHLSGCVIEDLASLTPPRPLPPPTFDCSEASSCVGGGAACLSPSASRGVAWGAMALVLREGIRNSEIKRTSLGNVPHSADQIKCIKVGGGCLEWRDRKTK